MTSTLDLAILAGASYNDTRSEINRFPLPQGWTLLSVVPSDDQTGFEARTFQKGTEIVISFAGTDPSDISGDIAADAGLVAGTGSAQLLQAVEYYLQVKAANPGPPAPTITLTGHSLGGGLAALVGVFFGVNATTFDQAPFAQTALFGATDLKNLLVAKLDANGNRIYSDEVLAPLTSYIEQKAVFGAPATLIPNEGLVRNIIVQGEILSIPPGNIPRRIGTTSSADTISNTATGASSVDLHSQTLLTAFLQSKETATNSAQTLSEVTLKLPDLLKLIFDSKLYAYSIDKSNTTDPNFLELIVNHQAGRDPKTSSSITPDAMVTRFTSDLWKLAQDSGMTMKDGSSNSNWVNRALIAFAMQKYYEEQTTSAGYNKELFTDLTTGGLRFDMADVSSKFATAFQDGKKLTLSDAKGFDQFFKYYLDNNLDLGDVNFTAAEDQLILSTLPTLRDWYVQAGASGLNATDVLNRGAFMLGGNDADQLTGGSESDLLVGNNGDDSLNGAGGNDTLMGGRGSDTYHFTSTFGKDTVLDRDGLGAIEIDSQSIGTANGIGERNRWAFDLGAGVYANLAVYDDPRSSTGKRLVITEGADTVNTITIDNFDLSAAQGSQGYLGIKLDNKPKLAIKESGGNNVWGDLNFNPSSLAGQSSGLTEGGGESFALYLNQGAKAGDTITLSLSDLADKFKVVLGDRTVDANGAVITLTEGQTWVPIALIQQGDVSADASMQLSATYTADGKTVTSNAWGVNLKDAGQMGQTMNGDQRAKIIGAGNETQEWVTADKPTYGTYAWSETSWAADGTLINGKAAPDFSDVLRGNAGNDKINGLGGNDALDGGAGNDELDGGVGDDLIGGGTGSDNIRGGDGNDYINSSATLNMSLRLRPTDSWSPPAGQEVYTQGALWGIYKDTQPDDTPVVVWSGSNSPTGTDSDVIDGGAGNDSIIAGGGDDRVQGGTGDDKIDGLGGNDVLEGGDGKDIIRADGIVKDGYMNTAAAQYHGADFVDGGAGDDQLTGGGGNDVVYGGADNDYIWGDASGKTSEADYLDVAYHGNDYLDGEDGDDYIEGGGKNDTLYGGAGNDNLWGDTTAANVDTPAANAALWGDDYLDGEDGNDQLIGGGKDDTLYGGAGNDSMWGDESDLALAGELNGNDYLDGEDGNDYMVGGGKDDILYGGAGDDTMLGDDALDKVAAEFQGADYLDGEDGNDTLLGGGGDDTLLGGNGNDYLDGGTGADYMEGGAGDDTYVVDNEGDVVVEADAPEQPGGGSGTASIDNVETFVAYALGKNLDNLKLTGTDAINGTGNSLANIMTGNMAANVLDGGAGNDQLDGGSGADTLIGGSGDDFYIVDDAADVVVEAAGEGNDYVQSSVSFTLSDNVETLQATGSASIHLTGNSQNNTLFGNTGNNTLTGGTGNDYLVGGAGDDLYVFQRGDGQDTINNTDFLRDTANTSLIGATDALRFGSDVTDKDVLAFRSGNNMYLSIKGSADSVMFADYYAADSVNGTSVSDHKIDRVEFANGVVWDQAMVQTMVDRATNNLAPAIVGSIPMLQARAGSVFSYTVPAGTIIDPDAWDTVAYRVAMQDGSPVPAWLKFDAATRTLSGTPDVANIGSLQFVLWGTDNYGAAAGKFVTLDVQPNHAPVVSAALADQVISRGAAFELTLASAAFMDPDAGDTLTYEAALADGSALPSWLSFDAQTRRFAGTPPAVGSISVRVTARDDAGLSVSDVFDVVVQLPEILGTSNADVLVGGSDNDTIRGFGGDDHIDGGAGADTLYGGLGDDVYVVDQVGDAVLEAAGEGVDTVVRSFDTNSTLSANVENLTLAGMVVIGNGNNLDNVITGNDADNSLQGQVGNDTLIGSGGNDLLDGGTGADNLLGGTGDDIYLVDQSDDQVSEGASEGIDTVRAMASYTLSSNIETLVLENGAGDIGGTGNAQDNHLLGNSDNNRLDGGAGADILEGGLGNDTYVIDSAADQIIETSDGGIDTVEVDFTYALGQALENLTLIGSANIDATGNDGDNVLVGNAGDNRLDGGLGADTMSGGQGDDVYILETASDIVYEAYDEGIDTVIRSVDTDSTLSANVENLNLAGLVVQGKGNDLHNVIAGNSADNFLSGMAGDDTLIGGIGNDLLDGGTGADNLIGGLGDDVFLVDQTDDLVTENTAEGTDTVRATANYTLSTNVENLILESDGGYIDGTGNALANHLTGNEYDNRLDGGAGVDVLEGGLGNDTYVIDSTADQIIETVDGGVDTVEVAFTHTLEETLENLTLTGDANINATGNDGDNVLVGNAGNNRLDGGLGSDTMSGGQGDDMYLMEDAGNGNYYSGDRVYEEYDEGNDTIIRSFDTYQTLENNVENLILTGTAVHGNGNDLDNVVTGNDADNSLLGLAGNDTLIGGAGDDALFGQEGADTLVGGTGDDYYEIDNAADTIVENAAEGDDFVRSTVSWTLGANLERLAVDGSADLTVTGNTLDNGLWGNLGNNTLTGGLGNDYLFGDQGNDVYAFNRGDGQDSIDNTDILGATDTLRFGAGIAETDVMAFQYGSNMFFKIKGTTDQIGFINYYAANTTVDGQEADYKIDQVEFANGVVWDQAMIQTVVDRANNNHSPTVASYLPTLQAKANSAFSYTVAANTITDPDPWDSITYSVKMADGSTVPAWLNFDATTRTLYGTPGVGNVGTLQFILWGTDNYNYSAGEYVNMTIGAANRSPVLATALADQAAAQGGAFSYTVPAGAFTDPDSGDVLTYSATLADGSALPSWLIFNAATRVFSGTPTTTGTVSVKVTAKDSSNASASDIFEVVVTVQNLTLNGTANADTLVGGAGNDTLNGLSGNDTLTGGAGNDTLNGGAGNDTMTGGLGNDTYVVDSTSDVVTEVASEGIDLVQSSVTYTLSANVENLTLTATTAINGTGNALDNVLTGGSGVNVLTGGAGNDTYVVGTGDSTVEVAGGGIDTVQSAVTWTLATEVENLTLTGTSAINGTGNTLNNVLTGNSAANTLDGGAGADTLIGGAGNDTYVVDNTADVVTENLNEGTDLVQSSVTYTLSDNVENLTLTGTSAINGTGNALNNTLTGNSGANVLDGGLGADTLVGGTGNDTYYVDNASDVTTEAASAGTDTVISSINWTLATNLENLTLSGMANINATGNTVANVLTGNAGDNVLDGGTGTDTLVGGLGNDTYVIDVATDVVTEGLNAGIDLVQSGVTYTLGANVENLTLTGTTAINATGNALDNVLTGNSATNVLTGGAGNDTYVVGTGDTTVEAASAGTDTVQSAITWTLATNVENLTLTGSSAVNGTGNTADNVLLGNSGVNTLTGNAGNDTLNGGAGADVLVGGTGNDTYWLGRGFGFDSVTENDATAGNTDVARFDTGIATDQLWFVKSGNNLDVSIIGTTDKLTMTNWYLGSQYHVEQFKTSDGKTLLDSQVQNLVSAMAAFSPPAAGETTLSASYAASLNPVIAANWQ